MNDEVEMLKGRVRMLETMVDDLYRRLSVVTVAAERVTMLRHLMLNGDRLVLERLEALAQAVRMHRIPRYGYPISREGQER